MDSLDLRTPHTVESSGALAGLGLIGAYHSWRDGGDERYDESIGARNSTTLHVGDRTYIVNPSGDVRELHGLLYQREQTDDFVGSDGFVKQPQYDRFAGRSQLPDGRTVDGIVVSPPGGQPETVYLDAATSMIDRISYQDDDGTTTQDYYDYHVYDGVLLPQREVQSNGDHAYDVTHALEHVRVDSAIAQSVFAVPASTVVQTDRPVSVKLMEKFGHEYVPVRIHGHDFTFLLDSGAQVVVLDSHAGDLLGLKVQGNLEVSGTKRTGGLGVAPLDAVQIGDATLPVRVVSVLSLHDIGGTVPIDGILGYPLFAAAEVRIDPASSTLTIAKPGALTDNGTPFAVDDDRQLVEINARVNGNEGRFVVDTGNNNELLVYEAFANSHPGILPIGGWHYATNFGVGGSTRAVQAPISELDIGPFRLYDRYADVMMTEQGAFADRFDAGNIGMATLRNFVVTFDLPEDKLFARPGANFDDRRDRQIDSPFGNNSL